MMSSGQGAEGEETHVVKKARTDDTAQATSGMEVDSNGQQKEMRVLALFCDRAEDGGYDPSGASSVELLRSRSGVEVRPVGLTTSSLDLVLPGPLNRVYCQSSTLNNLRLSAPTGRDYVLTKLR